MSDCADNSDDKIEAAIAIGRAKAEQDALNFKLKPIIIVENSERYGVCHWCESPITPGHLFCEKDPHDPGMCCSESWDHQEKRLKALGL